MIKGLVLKDVMKWDNSEVLLRKGDIIGLSEEKTLDDKGNKYISHREVIGKGWCLTVDSIREHIQLIP